MEAFILRDGNGMMGMMLVTAVVVSVGKSDGM